MSVNTPPAPATAAVSSSPTIRRDTLARMKKELTILAVMIALAIVTALLNPVFLNADNLRNTIRHVSLISLFALGEAVVIIAGGIDLSVGSMICLSAVMTSYLTMYAGLGVENPAVRPIAIGSPATLFATSTTAAPAASAFAIFCENEHVPRLISAILPLRSVDSAEHASERPVAAFTVPLVTAAIGSVVSAVTVGKSPVAAL